MLADWLGTKSVPSTTRHGRTDAVKCVRLVHFGYPEGLSHAASDRFIFGRAVIDHALGEVGLVCAVEDSTVKTRGREFGRGRLIQACGRGAIEHRDGHVRIHRRSHRGCWRGDGVVRCVENPVVHHDDGANPPHRSGPQPRAGSRAQTSAAVLARRGTVHAHTAESVGISSKRSVGNFWATVWSFSSSGHPHGGRARADAQHAFAAADARALDPAEAPQPNRRAATVSDSSEPG